MGLRSLRTLLFLALVFTLYVISFPLPAVLFRQMATGAGGLLSPAGHVVKTGKTLAVGSLLGPIFGNFAVLANPLLLAGCVLILRRKARAGGLLSPAGHVVKTGKTLAVGSLLGPIFGNFAVLANPLLLAGCVLILRRKARAAVICLALAVLLALQTFQLMILPYHEDEAGVLVSFMIRPLVGWYCWFGAIVLALLLALEQHLAKSAGVSSESRR